MRPLIALLCATTAAAEPLDDKTIRKAVKLWADDEAKATKKYGHISTWDTSRVTDMDYLLGACWSDSRCVVSWSFNEDVSNWDTSNVKSMVSLPRRMRVSTLLTTQNVQVNMFRDTAFNQAIGVWDVSQVTDMSSMFEGADSFNQPLNGWDVSKVKSMYEMLEDCTAFNQPLDRWDTSSLTDMSYMFKYATKFNQPLNTWDVSTVTSTQRMFEYAYKFNQPLDNWRLDKAKEIKYMFQGASKFKQDLGWCLDDDVNQNDAFLRTKCEKTSCGVEGPPCQAPAEIVPAPTYRPTYKPSLRGSDDDDCVDDEDWSYTTKEGDVFTCERVAEKTKRCTIRFSEAGVRADDACKKTCGTC